MSVNLPSANRSNDPLNQSMLTTESAASERVTELLDINSVQTESHLASVAKSGDHVVLSSDDGKSVLDSPHNSMSSSGPPKHAIDFKETSFIPAIPNRPASSSLSQQLALHQTRKRDPTSALQGVMGENTANSEPLVIPGLGFVPPPAAQAEGLPCTVYLPFLPQVPGRAPYYVQLVAPPDCSARQLLQLARQRFQADLLMLLSVAPANVDPVLAAHVNSRHQARVERERADMGPSSKLSVSYSSHSVLGSRSHSDFAPVAPMASTHMAQLLGVTTGLYSGQAHHAIHTQPHQQAGQANPRMGLLGPDGKRHTPYRRPRALVLPHNSPIALAAAAREAAAEADPAEDHRPPHSRQESWSSLGQHSHDGSLSREVSTGSAREGALDPGFSVEDIFGPDTGDLQLAVWSDAERGPDSNIPPLMAFASVTASGFDTFVVSRVRSGRAGGRAEGMSLSRYRLSRCGGPDEDDAGDDDDGEEWSVSSRGRTSSHVPPRPPAHLLGSQFDPRVPEAAQEPPDQPPQGLCARLCARLCMRGGAPRQLHDDPRHSQSQTPAGGALPDRHAARYGVGASEPTDDDSDDDIGVPIAADAEGFPSRGRRQVEMTRL